MAESPSKRSGFDPIGTGTTAITTPDDLDPDSRAFFERAKLKMSYSLYWAAWSLVLLGITAISATNCQAYNLFADHLKNTGQSNVHIANEYYYKYSGWGFAAFAACIACILALIAALYQSPLLASPAEKDVLRFLKKPPFGPGNSTSTANNLEGGPDHVAKPSDVNTN